MIDYNVRMSCGSVLNGYIYMSSINLNGLFRYDIQNKSLEYVSPFLEEKPSYALYNNSFTYKSEIWFVPQNGNKIAVYDTAKEKFDYLEPIFSHRHKLAMDKSLILSLSSGKMGDSRIFVLPAGIDGAMIIDMKNREITSIRDVISDNEYVSAGIFHTDKIYGFTGDGKWRIEIDISSETVERVEWNQGNVADIVWNADYKMYIIALYDQNHLLLVDENFDKVQKIEYGPTAAEVRHRGRIFSNKDSFYVMPWHSTIVEEVTIDKLEAKEIDLRDLVINNPQCVEGIDAAHLIGLSQTDNILLTMDSKTTQWHCDRLVADLSDIRMKAKKNNVDFFNLFWNDEMRIISENTIGLSGFLELIEQG